MSLLKNFYNNYNESDEEESEQDSDFVPDENESDDQEFIGEEDQEEEDETNGKDSINKKRELSPELKEDVENKKTRIDAIWAEMNSKKPTTKITPKDDSNDDKNESTKSTPVDEKSKSTTTTASQRTKKQQRPRSQLSSLVSKYNIKEPKMNTLEKSKLDWQKYVDREGIRDELTYKNKDGYMEKVAFLQRVDDRRLNQLKEGQKKEKKNK
ncbi:MAG: bucentaur or craniofacial development-domain-containing protein [Benjaminiella poitrasii]|nr:MAG: bucentaur or craniofacial development-domain-containing protein [Benjaminiella poitrasii]